MKRWLGASEALATLKVKPQTLYASVSRGRVRAKPDPTDSRKSLYNGEDIERMSSLQQGRRSAEVVAAQTIKWGEPVLNSSITTVFQGRLFYRGRDAIQLADTATFEETCALLWDVPNVALEEVATERPIAPVRMTGLKAALVALASRTESDFPTLGRSAAVLAVEAGSLVASTAKAIAGGRRTVERLLHKRVARAWQAPAAAEVIRTSLVLLADHELNASTFAARVAVSTGAPLSAGMLAGLATLTGPLHGGASAGIQTLARTARVSGINAAVRRWLEQGGVLRAFGHPLYPQGDPRAVRLMGTFRVGTLYSELAAEVEAVTGERPNVDFALAAMVDALNLPALAPLSLFAIARSGGWMAHALEQVATGEIIRPRAKYVGLQPDA